MIVRKKESTPVDPPKKPLAGPRVDQPAPSNPLPTPQPFIRPDFFTREQVEAARAAQARKFATPATGKIEGEGLIDVVVPVVAAPIAKAIVKPLATAFSKTATKLADDAFAPIAKKIDPNLPLTKPKTTSLDVPSTAAPKGQSKTIVGVLDDDAELFTDALDRSDIFESGTDIMDVLPKKVEIDGKTFHLVMPEQKAVASAQAKLAQEYNRKSKILSSNPESLPVDEAIEQISKNKYGTDTVIENLQKVKETGVESQNISDLDRVLLSFYQDSVGNRAVNTKRSDAYLGLANHLRDKIDEIILKQPKSTADTKLFSGRDKFENIVSLYDDNGNKTVDKALYQLKENDVFSLNTILSASLNKSKSGDFGNSRMTINVPKGTSTFSMNVARKFKSNEFAGILKEMESLLYSDAKFRVDKITKSGMKVTLMNPKMLIPAFVTLKLNENNDESEE